MNLPVVILKVGKLLPGVNELVHLHSLVQVVVQEGFLPEHAVKPFALPCETLRHRRRRADRADCLVGLGDGATRGYAQPSVAPAHLEPSWAPIYEIDFPVGLNRTARRAQVFRSEVAAVHHATAHIPALFWLNLGQEVALAEGLG